MVRRKFALLKNFLEYIGVEEGRVNFSWISASEGARFAKLAKSVTEKVKELGPNKGLTGMGNTSCEGMSSTNCESESDYCGCE